MRLKSQRKVITAEPPAPGHRARATSSSTTCPKRRSRARAAGSSRAPRRSCAGSIRSTGCSTRRTSSALPRRAGSSPRSRISCSAPSMEQARVWFANGLYMELGVNLSAQFLGDLRFPDRLLTLIRENNLDPSMVTLELTETAAMAGSGGRARHPRASARQEHQSVPRRLRHGRILAHASVPDAVQRSEARQPVHERHAFARGCARARRRSDLPHAQAQDARLRRGRRGRRRRCGCWRRCTATRCRVTTSAPRCALRISRPSSRIGTAGSRASRARKRRARELAGRWAHCVRRRSVAPRRDSWSSRDVALPLLPGRVLRWLAHSEDSRMNRILKLVGIVVGAVIVLVSRVARRGDCVLFDPNDYKDEIAAAVASDGPQAHARRQARARGVPERSASPSARRRSAMHRASAANRWPRSAARSSSSRCGRSCAGKVEIGEASLHGLELNLARDARGRNNWQDLGGAGRAPRRRPPAPTSSGRREEFDLGDRRASRSPTRASLGATRRPAAAGSSRTSASTPTASGRARNFRSTCDLRLRGADVAVKVDARRAQATLSPGQRRYRLDELVVDIAGRGEGWPGGQGKAHAEVRLARGEPRRARHSI